MASSVWPRKTVTHANFPWWSWRIGWGQGWSLIRKDSDCQVPGWPLQSVGQAELKTSTGRIPNVHSLTAHTCSTSMHHIPSCFPGLSQGQPEMDQKTPPLRTPVARARGRHMDVPHQQTPPAPLCTLVWWPRLRQSSYMWSDDHASASPYNYWWKQCSYDSNNIESQLCWYGWSLKPWYHNTRWQICKILSEYYETEASLNMPTANIPNQ